MLSHCYKFIQWNFNSELYLAINVIEKNTHKTEHKTLS